MYEDLVERLRSVKDSWQTEEEDLMLEAADTIEYLSSYFEYYCPHYIQNVHDGDDKSLCAFWGCDVKSLPRWIPVTERLPKIGDPVLCYCRANIYEIMSMQANGGWMGDGVMYMSSFVTHWMPCPKAPEEE